MVFVFEAIRSAAVSLKACKSGRMFRQMISSATEHPRRSSISLINPNNSSRSNALLMILPDGERSRLVITNNIACLMLSNCYCSDSPFGWSPIHPMNCETPA